MVGGLNLPYRPISSRAGFWRLFQSSLVIFAASKACNSPGWAMVSALPAVEWVAQSMAVPLVAPFAESDNVPAGCAGVTAVFSATGVIWNSPLENAKAFSGWLSGQ